MMTFTAAARELGVDIKTLRRWFERAEIPIKRDPIDDRPRLIADHHVEELARIHDRPFRPALERRIEELERRVAQLESGGRRAWSYVPVTRSEGQQAVLHVEHDAAPHRVFAAQEA
jgi:hypothetical protein